MKVLVVHRQSEIKESVKAVLQTSDSIFRFSDSGLDGLLAARIENFDLIICSTDLPVITGFEMIRSLRNDPMNKKTPVIMLVTEIQKGVECLTEALQVTAMLQVRKIKSHLEELVRRAVTVAPDMRWEDLIMTNRMN